MAKFETNAYMCRTTRPIKIYRSVYDNNDSGILIPKLTTFISTKQYVGGQTEMYHISNGTDKGIGYWCPANVLQKMPAMMEEEKEELPTEAPADAVLLKGKIAKIKGSQPVVYATHDGDRTIPHCLKKGDKLDIDYAITTSFNGTFQFRYHIKTARIEDTTLEDKWLLQNSSVEINQDESSKDDGELTEMIRSFEEVLASTPMPMHVVLPEQYAPGVNMPEINTENFNIFDHIPDSWKSVIPDNWMDYMPEGWTVPAEWFDGVPENWLDAVPLEWMDNIPQAWKDLKFPEIPEISITGYLPDNWGDLVPVEVKETILATWKDGVPKNWYEVLPKEVRDKIPAEWKNMKFPDLPSIDEVTGNLSNYWNSISKTFSEITSSIHNLNFPTPWQHDTTEDPGAVGNYIDYTDPEAVASVFQNQHEYYSESVIGSSLVGFPIGRMLFVHGMPFQFTSVTDRRSGSVTAISQYDSHTEGPISNPSSDVYGRSFAKEIAASMPIATIVPGKPKFLTNIRSSFAGGMFPSLFASSDQKDAAQAIGAALAGATTFDDLFSLYNENQLEGDYDYYSLEVDTTTFFEYVNSMAHTSARLLGIGGMKYLGTALSDFDWGGYNTGNAQDTDTFLSVAGLDGGISFAYDPTGGGVSDTISNQTTESSLGSKLNQFSAQAREIEFLLGYSGVNVGEMLDSTNFAENAVPNAASQEAQSGISNAIGRIGSWLGNSIHGMNIKFPEIWSDSQHTRSYEIEMHFIAPYATRFCKWRYVLVPFYHAFALAAPRSDKNVSQYRSPFLIRAFSKGYFNVEMGMIESINYKRYGDGGMITDDGIPLQIDVSLQFKDLYHVLTMTNMYRSEGGGRNVTNFFNNTGLMDMIGTLSGVDMNRIDMGKRLELLASSKADTWGSWGTNYMRRFSDRARNVVEKFYGFG